ncbi:MAG TPA: thiamine pyrophosphate-dependent enzyme, partial [Intrasporangium sp.]|nr:thiamine pyrophosphate-dependent enzyme [Intrasporangium sp.]
RYLQAQGEGFYTIGSSGHESNAAVALALRPSDPALLHYRSGGFYCARAGQVPGTDAAADILRSLTCSIDDPISGGRHKVFGHPDLMVIPQTSTIASHLPRALGMAFSLERRAALGVHTPVPSDAVVVTSLGDASVNHSTAVGALNAAGQLAHRGAPLPLLVLCEDNGIGISVRTPTGWTRRTLESLPGFHYLAAEGTDPEQCLAVAAEAVERVRTERKPVILHLSTVRLMGHAGSDVELAYRSRREIEGDYAADPLIATARALHARGLHTPADLVERYEAVRGEVEERAKRLMPIQRLATAQAVMRPLTESRPARVRAASAASAPDRAVAFAGKLPEDAGPLTLAQSINAALTDLMALHRDVILFGEDVAAKGGVYGVTRGLRKRFGAQRVFDTLLDEQTILGTALGSALAGFLPVPEIQYLAYLHNAEDQLRGEAATLRFFSNGQFGNGMLVRVQGLAYQKGFGGHYHNDNSLAVLRDIPGLVLATPSSAAEAPRLLRAMAALAREESRVCVLVEPIALYHTRDLESGDGVWAAPYVPPEEWGSDRAEPGTGTAHGDGRDVLVVTFGNGVPMSLRAVAAAEARAARDGRAAPRATVYDLRWLAPLPVDDLLERARGFDRVLVVDETRRSGGVSEGVVTALVDGGYRGAISRVTSKDSIIPLGPAAGTVLLSEDEIIDALLGGTP